MRWPVPLLLTLPAAFALAWAASRVFAYYVWPVDVVVADFAAMALPSHYDVTAIVAGFRDAVIVPLVRLPSWGGATSLPPCATPFSCDTIAAALHGCRPPIHAPLHPPTALEIGAPPVNPRARRLRGRRHRRLHAPTRIQHARARPGELAQEAISPLRPAHRPQSCPPIHAPARPQHRAVAPIANISALGLAAMSIYAMFIREGGMVPVGFAAWLTNIVALVLMVGGIVVGVAAVKSSRPNFVLHRRAMIVAAGGLFMNAAQRFALVVVAHVPALVPASQNTWPQYRDGAWEAGLYAGTAVCFAGAAAYAWGALGTGAAAAAALQAQVDGVTARKRE